VFINQRKLQATSVFLPLQKILLLEQSFVKDIDIKPYLT
jgi:hypothetical protein